ncbi:hypothetical protein BRYFOR_06608 [Marvinbryantia formatexigens DSM 14469]|uniref:Uncharacterized protein n=1 Tax=Marvinbryantia formatexigens DSM 14469 TaxID=478749 RepID=C6LDJ9_9FIRM|nr:hypothetical protein BRYFOR_06608 [Marvinbryantia formatexigens DSM 14469]
MKGAQDMETTKDSDGDYHMVAHSIKSVQKTPMQTHRGLSFSLQFFIRSFSI